MNCGMKCIKILLYIFNFVFCVVGLALIIAGAVVMTKFKDYVSLLGQTFSTAPLVVIIVGVIIFIIAFFGFCGAVKESRCMIVTFAVLLVLVLIFEIAAAIAGFVMSGKVKGILTKGIKEMIPSYSKDKKIQKVIDHVQNHFGCCGADSYANWNGTVPESCCKKIPCDTKVKANINEGGCVDAFGEWVRAKVGLVAGVSLGVCFIEIVGIVFACCLSNALSDNYERV